MLCIYCRAETRVVNSRHQKRQNQVWRRRKCDECLAVFTTLETPDLSASLLFKAKTGKIEPFERDKLLLSIYDSLRHRSSAISDASALSATILAKLLPEAEMATIDRLKLLEIAQETLTRFDRAAAISYEAFHHD